jgi:hypothetical protein
MEIEDYKERISHLAAAYGLSWGLQSTKSYKYGLDLDEVPTTWQLIFNNIDMSDSKSEVEALQKSIGPILIHLAGLQGEEDKNACGKIPSTCSITRGAVLYNSEGYAVGISQDDWRTQRILPVGPVETVLLGQRYGKGSDSNTLF